MAVYWGYCSDTTAGSTISNGWGQYDGTASFVSTATFVLADTGCSSYGTVAYSPPVVVPTPEQLKAQQKAEEERRALRAREEQERKEAVMVAEVLLAETLGVDVLAEYKAKGKITVDSPGKPGRRYIVDGKNMIDVYEGNERVDRLCLHLIDGCQHDSQWLPEADVVVGKALLLQLDEERVLSVANHNRP